MLPSTVSLAFRRRVQAAKRFEDSGLSGVEERMMFVAGRQRLVGIIVLV
jgi:hypothetical protein